MRLWGGMRSWPNLFQTSESVSSQFVCVLVWILCSYCQLPHRLRHRFCFVFVEKSYWREICMRVGLESLMCWTATRLKTWVCERTHSSLSLLTEASMFLRLNSMSCSDALRCNFAAHTTHYIYTHTCSLTLKHSHTANILFSDQHNTLSPPQLFLSPSQPATRFLLVALCVPRNAERSVELSVINLLQHSL